MADTLYAKLSLHFHNDFANLPAWLQELVGRRYVFSWDSLTPAQRMDRAEAWDRENPVGLLEQKVEDEAFVVGFKRVTSQRNIHRRNAALAKRPRPSRQRITDYQIRAIAEAVKLDGTRPQNRCAEAYRRLAPPVSLRAFQKRWLRLGLRT